MRRGHTSRERHRNRAKEMGKHRNKVICKMATSEIGKRITTTTTAQGHPPPSKNGGNARRGRRMGALNSFTASATASIITNPPLANREGAVT